MSASCHDHAHAQSGDPTALATPERRVRYRRILWAALVVNAGMAALELAVGWRAGSVSLLADAIDFSGDALNYGVSLAVLAAAAPRRAWAALFKAGCMAVFGVAVLGRALWSAWQGSSPEPLTMGGVALLALAANLGVAALLYAFREGDANMRSVWLCTRNDALGNLAVLLAAAGVFGTGTAWPDLAVASLMAVLALQSSWAVWAQARRELGQASGFNLQ
jgi:Co/Zn/Cd efflux system component